VVHVTIQALALPTEEAAKLALHTQQILAHESGITNTVDLLAGSYYVEAPTHEIEVGARAYLREIEGLGGASQAIDFMQHEVQESTYRHQMEIEENERLVVGVNVFEEDEDSMSIENPDFSGLETAQRLCLEDFKARRDPGDTSQDLEGVWSADRSTDNSIPPMIEAVKTSATLGEISEVLRDEWGSDDP